MSLSYRYFRGNKQETLNKIRELLKTEEKVSLAIVFGSFVELESYRDIDIAVYVRDDGFDYLAKLSAKLELTLGIPVDVVPLLELDPLFRWKVLRKGTVIVERQPGLYEALLSMTQDELKLIELAEKMPTVI